MDKLVNCKACGKEIAKGVKKCPHCGKDQRSFFGKHKIVTGILVIVILIILGTALGGNKGTSTSSNSGSSAKASGVSKKTADNKKYSFDKFMKVTMGMSYDQVKGILGDGTEESSTGSGDLKTISYSWKNDDGSNMSVMLQGNKVITKSQAFLQSMDANVTMDKYNKISNGMPYDQVKGSLGEGQLISQSSILGSTAEIYSWMNKDGSNMNITFKDGKVESKAQFNLK